MARQNLQYLATQWSGTQLNFVGDLIRESGILRTAAVGFSNNGLFHKYNKITGLPAAAIRSINAGVEPQSTKFALMQLDLKELMTVELVDATLAQGDPAGVEGYFTKVSPAHIESLAQAAEAALVYGINPSYGTPDAFKGLHDYASDFGNEVTLGGTTSTTSIFAVTWKPEITQIVIPQGIASGESLVKMTPQNNGQASLVDVGSGKQMPAYRVMYQMLMALQSGSKYGVAHMVGMDASNKPTVGQVDQLVDLVKGSSADTVLYMNRDAKRLLQELKATKFFSQASSDQNMNTVLEFWNSIPIVITDAILNTENKANVQ